MIGAVVRNFAAQGLGVLISVADRFLVVGLLLRSWGPQVYSEWVVLFSFANLLTLGELGLSIYYGNIWQQASAVGDAGKFQRMVSVAIFCSGAVAFVVGAFSLAVLALLNGRLPITSLSRNDAVAVLILIGAAVLSRIARGSISQIYRGKQAFARGTIVDLVPIGGTAVLTAAAALLGAGPVLAAALYLACDLIAGWCLMLKDLSGRWPDLHFRPSPPTVSEISEMTRHVKWFALQQGGPVAWLHVPVLLLSHTGTTGTALVSFSILRTLVNFARSFGTILSIGTGVEIAYLHHDGRTEDTTRHLMTVGGALSVMVAAIAAGVALFGAAFVAQWTGRPDLFDPCIAGWLIASAVIAAPATPLMTHFMLINAPKPASIALLTQLGVGLLACWMLSRQYGALGAAAGTAIGEAVAMGAVLPAMAVHHIGINYTRYAGRCLLGMILTALWCYMVGMALHSVINIESPFGLMVASGLWGIFGVAPALIAVFGATTRRNQRPSGTRQAASPSIA